MNKLICFLLILFCFQSGISQEQLPATQLSFAYYGNVINEQGARISSQFYLKDWNIEKESEKSTSYSLFLQPNLGFVSRPLFNSNFQLATDFGIRRQGSNSKYYHAFAVGLGYLARMEIVSFTVDFKGEVIAKERETWDYIMPTISYEVARTIIADIGWFVKLNYGLRLPMQESQEESGMPLFEVGMKLPLKAKKD